MKKSIEFEFSQHEIDNLSEIDARSKLKAHNNYQYMSVSLVVNVHVNMSRFM